MEKELKDLKIQRAYKNTLGKKIGNQVWLHKDYISDLIDLTEFEKFKEKYLDYISEKLDFHFSDFAFFYDYTDPYIQTKDKSKTLFLINVSEATKPAFVRVPDGKKERKVPYLRRGSDDFPYDGSDPERTLDEFYEYWNSKNS